MNRSLKKIQTVLDSVQGVEGGLKFDPATGGFVAAGPVVAELDARNSLVFPSTSPTAGNPEPPTSNGVPIPPSVCIEQDKSTVKLEEDECYMETNQVGSGISKLTLEPVKGEVRTSNDHPIDCSEDSMLVATDAEALPPPWVCRENATSDSYFTGKEWDFNKDSLKFENPDCCFVSQCSNSMAAVEEMDTRIEGDDGIVEHNQPASSSMTDSSNGSGSLVHGCSSSSQSFKQGTLQSKKQPSFDENDSKITVKATYKEDIVRFKFDTSTGCFHLYEEVARRLKLQNGTFQLKYLDDEEEWVMLVSDADLQECLEIMDSIGTRSMKFLVRDIPCNVGSSSGSNCFLVGG